MAQIISGEIGRLDNRIEECASDQQKPMRCLEVEGIISQFISLTSGLEESFAALDPVTAEGQGAIGEFRHLVTVGRRIKGLIARLGDEGQSVAARGEFMRHLLRCRVHADTDSLLTEHARLLRGEIKTRPIQERIDELQRRDNASR